MNWDAIREGLVDELLKISAISLHGLSPETVMEKSQPPPPMETPGFDKARNILSMASQVKTAGAVKIPEGGLRSGLLSNDITQVMSPEDAKRVKENVGFFRRTGPGLVPIGIANAFAQANLGNLIAGRKGAVVGALTGGVGMPLIAHYLTRSGKFDKGTLKSARDVIERSKKAKTAARKRKPEVQQAQTGLPGQPGIGKLMTPGDSSAPEQAKSVAGYGLAGLGTGGAIHRAYSSLAPVHSSMYHPDVLKDPVKRFAASAKNTRIGRNLMLGGATAGGLYGGYRAAKRGRDDKMAKQGTIIKTATLASPALALKSSQQVGKTKITPSTSGPNTTTQIRGRLIGKKGIP